MTRQPGEDFFATLSAELAAAGIGPRRIAEIRAEVEDHLSESVRALQLQGQTADAAWQQAVARFGAPAELARRFAATGKQGGSAMTRLALLLARISLRSDDEPEGSRVAAPMRRTPCTRSGWLAAGVALVLLFMGGGFAPSLINAFTWAVFEDALITDWESPSVNAILFVHHTALELIGALLVGFGQWLMLRRWVECARWWILASGAGWGGAFAVAWIVNRIFVAGLYWEVTGIAMSLLVLLLGVGLFQWLLLRRWVRRAGWWLFASALGLGLPLGLSWAISTTGLLHPSAIFYLFPVPVLSGLIRGVALALLFAQAGNPSQGLDREAGAVADTTVESVARPRRGLALLGYT